MPGRASLITIGFAVLLVLFAVNFPVNSPYVLMQSYINSIRHIVSPQISLSMSDSVTEIHKPGTDDGWHGVIKEGGQFPPEPNRYHLYIGEPNLYRLASKIADIE